MITLFDLFRAYGIDPAKVRLVRHSDKEIPVLETFQMATAKFTEYTAWQVPRKFGKSKYLAVFAPARSTNSLFLGLWKIEGLTKNKDLQPRHLDLLERYKLPDVWSKDHDHYDLLLTNKMHDLKQRLVIDWGKSTVSWVQTKDKNIVEIRSPNSIGAFTSYDGILLSFADLRRLVHDTESNAVWINALSSVNGVYLVKHTRDGRLYVGSAYGKGGILQRWTSYANTGHAGNMRLKGLDPNNFEFSLLEITPSTMSADDVIARENRWKECLGTREFGLNEN